MKILFLDFDGVMNNYSDFGRGPDPIHSAAVTRLHRIAARTDAETGLADEHIDDVVALLGEES